MQWRLNAMNEKSRLDRACAAIDALEQATPETEGCEAVFESLSGFEMTGASDVVRQAIESFGVKCNSITGRYETGNPEAFPELNETDAAEIAFLSRQFCELIIDTETDRIMSRLRHHGGRLPEDEIIEARRHRERFVPVLIQECRDEIERVRQYSDSDETSADAQHNSVPFFSIFLFSEWNIAGSVPIILEGIRLPGARPFDLFGDAIHEQLPRYLAQFLFDDLDRIDQLIGDTDLNIYVRWSSASSYKYMVRDRVITSRDAVNRLNRLFAATKVIADEGRPGLGHCYELSAGILDCIESISGVANSQMAEEDWAFVDESIFCRGDVSDEVDAEDQYATTSDLLRLPPTRLDDILQTLRHWGTFARQREVQRGDVRQRADKRTKAVISRPSTAPVPPPKAMPTSESKRTRRNAKCPCGSGKKYKQCCLHKRTRR